MRVLRVITRLNRGGPARQLLALGRRLPELGIVQLLCAGRADAGEDDLFDDFRAAGLALRRLRHLGRAVRPAEDALALLELIGAIRRWRPQVVHTHTAKAGLLGRLAAMLCGVPAIVHTYHGHVLEGYFAPPAAALLRLLERTLARRTGRLVALSERLRTDLSERQRIAPATRIAVIDPGCDAAAVQGGDGQRLRRALGLPPGALLVGWAGRLVPIKAPRRAVDVFEALCRRRAATAPPVHLALAGGGIEAAALAARIAASPHRARIHALGWLPAPAGRLPDFYAASDVLLLTSRSEGTPLTVLEAQAAGVPVVAPAVGGVADVLAGGIALRPDAGDDELASAVDTLLNDRERRRALAERGRALLRARFDGRALAEAHARLYRELLRERRHV